MGWQAIFAALLSSRLEKLNLHSNNMNDASVTSLLDALLHNTTIETLILRVIGVLPLQAGLPFFCFYGTPILIGGAGSEIQSHYQ
jgi:hypothetical protein